MTLLDLCELADVKARLDITDTSKDALLGDLITAVSRAIEQHCQREFYQESRTRVFDTRRKDEALALPAYPVSSITSVKTSTDFDFSATTASAVSSNYPDLAAAAQMQVVEEYMRKEAQGSVQYSLSDGGGALNREALKLLPAVRERLAYYRRLVF
jgi:hypothetical protein